MNLKQLLEIANCNIMIMRSDNVVMKICIDYVEESKKLLSDILLFSEVLQIAVSECGQAIKVWLNEGI